MWWKQVIAGLLLGTLIGILIVSQSVIFKGPRSTTVIKTIYYDPERKQHYRFVPITHVCPPSIDLTTMEHSETDDESGDEPS